MNSLQELSVDSGSLSDEEKRILEDKGIKVTMNDNS